jgi:hypothetical protein
LHERQQPVAALLPLFGNLSESSSRSLLVITLSHGYTFRNWVFLIDPTPLEEQHGHQQADIARV